MIDYDLIKTPSAPFVFFLHGWAGSKESFYLVKNHIAGYCNMVFVSFSGFGSSPEPKTAYTVKDYAIELKNLIVKLAKGKKVMIVCHSFGARVAVKLISLYKELVSKLFIIDGAGVKPKRGVKYWIKVRKYKALKKKVACGKVDKSKLEKYGSSDYKVLSSIMKQTFINVVNEDLKQCYKEVNCPTLLFWGEKDKETPLFMARKIKKWVKGSGLVVIKGAGHFSYLDERLTFIEVLKRFLFEA